MKWARPILPIQWPRWNYWLWRGREDGIVRYIRNSKFGTNIDSGSSVTETKTVGA